MTVYTVANNASGNQVTIGQAPLTPVQKIIIITGGTTFTANTDFNTSNNWVVCIAGGGGAGMANATGANVAASAGQGGSWAQKFNLPINPGDIISLGVGLGGAGATTNPTAGTAGANTWFNGTSLASCLCGAQGGAPGVTSAATATGGSISQTVVGDFTAQGGAGGNQQVTTDGGAGGGGAGGPGGNGGAGGLGGAAGEGGAGGGGASGGTAGTNGASGNLGQQGGSSGTDGTVGGTGGASNAPGNPGANGSGGGGGGGSTGTGTHGAGGLGGAGIGYIQTSDSSIGGPGGGGGGGGGSSSISSGTGGAGGNGGLYGGGGASGGFGHTVSGIGGSGANGVIIVSYYSTTDFVPDSSNNKVQFYFS